MGTMNLGPHDSHAHYPEGWAQQSTPHNGLPSPTPPLVSDETDLPTRDGLSVRIMSDTSSSAATEHHKQSPPQSSRSLDGSTGPDSPYTPSDPTMTHFYADEFFSCANTSSEIGSRSGFVESRAGTYDGLSGSTLGASGQLKHDVMQSQDRNSRSSSLTWYEYVLSAIDQWKLPPPIQTVVAENSLLATVLRSLCFEAEDDKPSKNMAMDRENFEWEDLEWETFEWACPETFGEQGGIPVTYNLRIEHPEPEANAIQVLGKQGAENSALIRSVAQSSQSSTPSITKHLRRSPGGKIKRGLAGVANGFSVSAMADTGSRKNVVSAAYAAKLGLKIQGSPSSFTLGSSRQVSSIGTVSLLWSFAQNPEMTISIVCDVLPRCIYDLILGNGFLTATETMSKYRHRLTQCFFSMSNKLSAFAFLGEGCQVLEGILADENVVLAVPDTGAERNVMSLQFMIDHDLDLKEGPEHRNLLQFADGSYEETSGQVDTYWTFATGERIPVTFEILEKCCADVIIGEEICAQHNVFEDHGSSLILMDPSSASYELAPFDFITGWQRAFGLRKKRKPEQANDRGDSPHLKEQRRRDIWNYEYDYGASASTGEKELETARRILYDCQMPNIPSIPTAPSGHVPPNLSDPRFEGRSTR